MPSRLKPIMAACGILVGLSIPSWSQTCTVTNGNDTGPGSLRDRMNLVNSGGCNRITFNIPAGGGEANIFLATALPTVTRSVSIDATTQPGFATAGPRVHLFNGGAPAWAFLVVIDNVSISGFILERFTQGVRLHSTSRNCSVVSNIINGGVTGVEVLAGSTGNVIRDNLIGTNRNGANLGHLQDGIFVQSSGNTVSGNTIAFNRQNGIFLRAPGNNNRIVNNAIFANGPLPSFKAINLDFFSGIPANNGKAAPVFTPGTATATNVTLRGTAGSNDLVQVFVSNSQPQQALRFAAQTTATLAGAWSLTIPAGPNYTPTGINFYVATATSTTNNTSELSNVFSINGPGNATGDTISFLNPNGAFEVGVLVDGQLGGSQVNDASFVSTAGTVKPGNVSLGTHNEIIAYTNERQPALRQNVPWTAGTDRLSVTFPNEILLDFSVWLLQGPFAERNAIALAARTTVDRIWRVERQGTEIRNFTITDRTTLPASANFVEFNCGLAADMKAQIGFTPGRVNIYYVNTVDFGGGPAQTNGVFCGDNLIAMGAFGSDHLLAHEIGHSFGQGHVFPPNFDETNVMHNASNTREFLTEGQTFRAVFTSFSAINATYLARPGLALRDCPEIESPTDECPANQKRIFADGTFPPN